jgi:uncharacterized cysteine cluster protein YcgN (CxxCxxCC family)
MITESEQYELLLKEKEKNYESICTRCGRCCGSNDGDPCTQLILLANGTYFCKNYTNRLKEQKTVSDKKFNCISIKKAFQKGIVPIGCAYRENFTYSSLYSHL